MGISKREVELSQSLVTLQGQYNLMVEAKDAWRKKATDLRQTSEIGRGRLLDLLEQRDKEIKDLKNALSESREIISLMLSLPKEEALRDAEGA